MQVSGHGPAGRCAVSTARQESRGHGSLTDANHGGKGGRPGARGQPSPWSSRTPLSGGRTGRHTSNRGADRNHGNKGMSICLACRATVMKKGNTRALQNVLDLLRWHRYSYH